VEQISKLNLIINRKTTKTLGVIPEPILVRADQAI
jgi:hypothetical protein